MSWVVKAEARSCLSGGILNNVAMRTLYLFLDDEAKSAFPRGPIIEEKLP